MSSARGCYAQSCVRPGSCLLLAGSYYCCCDLFLYVCVCVSDMVLRQQIGIPMGTNCAVYVANLFSYTYEFAFIERLVNANAIPLLSNFQHTLRFVDDLLTADNTVFDYYLYESMVSDDGFRGIYPDFLTLNREQDSCEGVSFLDTWVGFQGGSWFTRIYDKREHPPLSRIGLLRYPHPSSFLSNRSKLGIVTSRLHCFARICQRKPDFVARSRLFLKEFCARGYPRSCVRRFVLRFLKHVPLQFPVRSRWAFMRLLMADC